MKFDGRALAREIEAEVALQVASKMKIIKIVNILVGENPASELYTKLKKEAAERVGIDYEIVRMASPSGIEKLIEEVNEDESVTGIMIQLPIPSFTKEQTNEVIKLISPSKDVDGMRYEESLITPATVRAVLAIIEKIGEKDTDIWNKKMVVVGARGAVGTPLIAVLKSRGVSVLPVEWDTENPGEIIRQGEVVISCVGKAKLIKPEMVKEGIIAIDVGINKGPNGAVGDMTREVYQKASVSVEVPGGVGPVTVVSLLKNAVEVVL